MLGITTFHYMNLLQDSINERNSLIRQFNGFRHNNIQFLSQASSVIIYVAAGIVVAAAALAGLLILLQT